MIFFYNVIDSNVERKEGREENKSLLVRVSQTAAITGVDSQIMLNNIVQFSCNSSNLIFQLSTSLSGDVNLHFNFVIACTVLSLGERSFAESDHDDDDEEEFNNLSFEFGKK